MDHATHNKIVSFIWSIADDCLRDVFVRGKYCDVILPMFVLRRIDCLLEDTKEAVLAEVKFQKDEAGMAVLDPDGLREASGQVFYNTSKFTLKSLLGNPSQLEANFNYYLDGFSSNVAEIIAKFDLRNQIRKMGEADALHGAIEKFVAPDINLSHHDAIGQDGRKLPCLTNLGMGYVFEELIRKFNEENNEEAGEHFTPREVIQLMIHLLFEPVKRQLPPVITFYDSACGSGGMLTEAQDFIINASQLYQKRLNNLGAKSCDLTEAHIGQITRAYLDLLDTGKQSVDGLKSQVFEKSLATEMEWISSQWGEDVYQKDFLTGKKEVVQRWLDHEQIELTGANLKKFLDPKLWLARRELLDIAGKPHKQLGEKSWDDFTLFTEDVKAGLRKIKPKPGAPQLKAILDAVSWRDSEAAPIAAKEIYLEIDCKEQRLAARNWYPVVEDGSATIYEPDSELRDTENIPLAYGGGIEAYFHKEVLPHFPDAWIDDSKTVIGYETSFNKDFYVHQPLHDLAEIVNEIRDLEAETEGLLEQILSFSD